ncbi:MAG: 30S ribosomal protein S19e [Candidatus Syntropharchaeia archaeon]
MTTIYDVPPDMLVLRAAEKMKGMKSISPPKWARYIKTGVHRELPPVEDDWWFKRCASVLRQIYIHGPVGTSRLRTRYGGRERRGVKEARFKKGSGSIIREVLRQLEKGKFIKKTKKGRIITPKGQSFLDNVAYEIKKELVSEIKELEKY